MLFELFAQLTEFSSVFNVGKYITFRALAALITALVICIVLSPWFIRRLKSRQIGQVVRDDGPKSHFSKAGTPTMGGGIILFSVLLSALLWMDLKNHFLWLVLIITAGYGVIGFIDDYQKVSKKNTGGLSGRVRLIAEIILATIAVTIHYISSSDAGVLHFPFFKDLTLNLGAFYVPFAVLVIVGTSNAVNLTDGLDGLAIGPIMTTASAFAILSYVTGNSILASYLNYPYLIGTGELAILCMCLIGAGMGFLWYNTYPAQVFMGDVGSLPLGGTLGAIAVFTKHELLLMLIGGIFVVEALSVITQVASFKLTGKRVFKMAPIHHHFELKGWPEPRVIVRFWIISIMLAIFGIMSLKLR